MGNEDDPTHPRRVYMFGKGEGSKISMEFMMTHPDIVTAAIGYSWGASARCLRSWRAAGLRE